MLFPGVRPIACMQPALKLNRRSRGRSAVAAADAGGGNNRADPEYAGHRQQLLMLKSCCPRCFTWKDTCSHCTLPVGKIP
jgi:hypothetical protein